MRHGSLFSGIGGFDLAAEWMGWENVFHCEWNEFGKKILNYYWPNAESFDDITKTDFKKYANKIDILTGGFPCQPFSLAGKRKGKEDERYLWHEMLRAIREIKPKYIVGENVFGLLNWNGGLVFDEVHTDLELEGYEVQAVVIPAAAVNAPHGRDRVWFVAYSNGNDGRSPDRQGRCKKQKTNGKGEQPIHSGTWTTSNEGNVTNPNGNGLHKRNGQDEIKSSKGGKYAQCNIESIYNEEPIIEHPNGIGQERRMHKDEPKTTIGKQFGERNARSIGTPTWDNFPTQSPICGGDDGLPSKLDGITFSKWRNESIKGYGNAIVPQVAYEIFKVLQHIDNSLK